MAATVPSTITGAVAIGGTVLRLFFAGVVSATTIGGPETSVLLNGLNGATVLSASGHVADLDFGFSVFPTQFMLVSSPLSNLVVVPPLVLPQSRGVT